MKNRIHSTAILSPDVELGTGNTIGPNSLIIGPCKIGDNNWIGPNVVIGTPAEWQGIEPEPTWDIGNGGIIVIGSNNIIREFSSVHVSKDGLTEIKNETYLMTRSYIPHDAIIEDGVKLATGVKLGGFAHIAKYAYLGMGSIVHQKLHVGEGSMVGMGTVVTKNVPPLSKFFGNPGRVRGINSRQIHKFKLSKFEIDLIKQAYDQSKLPDVDSLSDYGKDFFSKYINIEKSLDDYDSA